MPPYTYTINRAEETTENATEIISYEGFEAPNQKNWKTLWGMTVMPIKWINVLVLGALHIMFITILLRHDFRKYWATALYCILLGIISGFGVTSGAHRYWSHRSFKAKKPMQLFFIFCFASCGMLRIYDWVRDHRVHHKYSETNADPHNATRGFFFSHVGWLLQKRHPEVIIKGKRVDMSDILEDPLIQFHDKYFYILQLFLCFILPPLVPYYLLGDPYSVCFNASLFRWGFNLNGTWSVNSFAHYNGTRPYNSKIVPVENYWVSFFTLGEGWHNYHHTFPWDYRAGEFGNLGPNATRSVLEKFAEYGWVWDLKVPSEDLVRKTIESNGDGTHPIFGIDKILPPSKASSTVSESKNS